MKLNHYQKEEYYKRNSKYIKIIPFVMESTGAFGESADVFLSKIASYNNNFFNDNDTDVNKSVFLMHIRRVISVALQIGNSIVFDEGINSLLLNFNRLNNYTKSNISDKLYLCNSMVSDVLDQELIELY